MSLYFSDIDITAIKHTHGRGEVSGRKHSLARARLTPASAIVHVVIIAVMTSSSFAKALVPLLAVAVALLLANGGGVAWLPFLDNSTPVLSDTQTDIDGMPFPNDIKVAGSKQSLIGGGTRSKWGFRVYAVGIYGDRRRLNRSIARKYSGANMSDARWTELSSDFATSRFARTLLLRFHREVASSDMSEALGEALMPRVGGESSSKFSSFILNMVGSDTLPEGSDIFITCKGERVWASLREGKDADTISIKGLCSAIFQVYVGDAPVSPQAKEGFEKGFADMIAS